MKRIIMLMGIAVIIIAGNVFAQPLLIPGMKPLNVGDKVPDAYLASIVNYKKKDGKLLTDFGNKPILLDTWNIHCSTCIQAMPHLDSMQKEFGDKLTILLVNPSAHDSTGQVIDFYKKNKYAKDLSLPSTTRDSVLGSFFPGEPHKIWIDKNGIVQSISTFDQATRENVKKFVEGRPLKLKQLEREPDENLTKLPLMVLDQNYNSGRTKLSASYISGYDSITRKGMFGPSFRDGFNTIHIVNKDIQQLYKFAYYATGLFGNPFKTYQFIVESTHVPAYDERADMFITKAKDLFCYEAFTKDSSAHNLYKKMQQDLDNFFHVKSSFEFRELPCYILRKINMDENRVGVTNDHRKGYYFTENEIELSKERWTGFMHVLNSRFSIDNRRNPPQLPYIVLDETGYVNFKGELDITIPSLPEWKDLKEINKILVKYNLQVSIEKRELPVIVLRD